MARKRKPEEHANHERWLVSYADFITLLFAFFTTLYAISTVDQKKVGKLMYSMRTAFKVDFFDGGPNGATRMVSILEGISIHDGDKSDAPAPQPVGEPGDGRLKKIAKKLGELALDPALKGKFQVRMEGRGLVISLAEAGFFPSGSATVKPDAVDSLALLARSMSAKDIHVTIEGHTDNVPVHSGRYGSNWELSTARASSVVAMFIDQGLDPAKLSASGYGEFKPVAPNDTSEGRARNRRVDIVLSPDPVSVDVPPDAFAPKVTAPSPSISL